MRNDSRNARGVARAPTSQGSLARRRMRAGPLRDRISRARGSGTIARSPSGPPSGSFRSSRHAPRRRQRRPEGADPRRGAALHPALPRQGHRHQVRRQRDDRACAQGGLRARRRHAEARRHEPGDRPRRRPADRRPAEEDGHRERIPAGDARHRRQGDERRRDGAGRAQPGDRRASSTSTAARRSASPGRTARSSMRARCC